MWFAVPLYYPCHVSGIPQLIIQPLDGLGVIFVCVTIMVTCEQYLVRKLEHFSQFCWIHVITVLFSRVATASVFPVAVDAGLTY